MAAVQAGSVLYEKNACLDRVASLSGEAAARGAALVVFPEAFVPGYPRGEGFGMVVGSRTEEGRALFERYRGASVVLGGEDGSRLGEIARTNSVFLAVGVVERDGAPNSGTLYCSIAYFGPDGSYLGKHRKLKPTASERLVWGEGDGSTLTSVQTPVGRVGGLICWENYMPLARAAMYEHGLTVYLAPTADQRDGWQATMRHVALESRCYVVGCNQFVPDDGSGRTGSRGGSVIVDPLGEVIAGPLWDEDGILTAEIDPSLVVRSRLDFDPIGHYARRDVFELRVHRPPE